MYSYLLLQNKISKLKNLSILQRVSDNRNNCNSLKKIAAKIKQRESLPRIQNVKNMYSTLVGLEQS